MGWFSAFNDSSQLDREMKLRQEVADLERAKAELERAKAELESQRLATIATTERKHEELRQYQDTWRHEYERLLNEARDLRNAFEDGFLRGRQWLADAFSEYLQTHDYELECALLIKPSPAPKAAETISDLRASRAVMARDLKLLQYQIASYEEYFPELLEYRDAILDEVVDLRQGASEALADVDAALRLGILSKEEYENMSSSEKFQLALDRYWLRQKSRLEIGRVYERYLGYLYETNGWSVSYHGILMGLEDFGRDLICERDGEVHIVQCKCWSKDKLIREKHILQLYGTTVLYRLHQQITAPELHQSHFDAFCGITPVFATTTELSEEAAMVADHLRVAVRNEPLKRYPMIKCNANPQTGERIYHLPFDQQYDRVIVGKDPGEFYAETTVEAEAAGFRRAFRWHGNSEQ